MDSKSSRFTVLNNEKDTIYISKNLLKEIARKNNLKQNGDTDPQPTEPKVVTPQVSVAPVVEKKTFSSDDFVDVPVSLDPEYVAKNYEFEPSTNLYGLHGKYERKLQQYQHAWRSRWESLNSLNEKLFKLNSEKFANQVRQAEEKYFKGHVVYEQPCLQNEARVINCFSLHTKKPLLCNEEVKKFNDCIQQARLGTLKN